MILLLICVIRLPTLIWAFLDVQHYMKRYPENKLLVSRLKEEKIDYAFVYPFQWRGRKKFHGAGTRNHSVPLDTLALAYRKTASFVVKSKFPRLRLNVDLNEGLIPSSALYRYFRSDGPSAIPGSIVSPCYYTGTVQGEAHSAVAVSTCHGLDGVVFLPGGTFIIHPLHVGEGPDALPDKHPHVFYQVGRPPELAPFFCGNTGSSDWDSGTVRRPQESHTRRRNKRDINKWAKHLELAVIVDSGLSKQSVKEETLQHVLSVTNMADIMLRRLGVRLSLVRADIWSEEYKSKAKVNILARDSTISLLNLIEFANSPAAGSKPDWDLIVFMTNDNLGNNESALAARETVCTKEAAGLLRDPHPYQLQYAALPLAHIVSHVLGILHDDRYAAGRCTCPGGPETCLLRPRLSGAALDPTSSGDGNFWPFDLSTCSLQLFNDVLQSGRAKCLLNKPMEEDTLVTCGNKEVDPGEDCDCGSVDECASLDPCCDANTCKLKNGAECATGPCCTGCKLLPKGKPCRPARSECDVPEVCDGARGQCPADAQKMNGIECAAGDGYCYAGECNTANGLCRNLWGAGAETASESCYTRYNSVGSPNGHCGRASNGVYIPCNSSDVLCGLAQCSGGEAKPVLEGFTGTFSSTQVVAEDGSVLVCRVATKLEQGKDDVGAIKAGTKCGRNKICVGRSCLPLSAVTPEPKCPSNNLALQCSGHGVCTNLDTCYCERGWAEADCSRRLDASQLAEADRVATMDQFITPPPLTGDGATDQTDLALFNFKLDTYTMLIILGCVSGAVFLLLVVLVLCYRRRPAGWLMKKQKMMLNTMVRFEKDSDYSDSATGGNRSIKFGQMPSYRDEKHRRKKRMLHRIREVDERTNSSNNDSQIHQEQLQPLTAPESPTGVLPSPRKEIGSPPIPVVEYPGERVGPGTPNVPERGILKNSFPPVGRSYSDAEDSSPFTARRRLFEKGEHSAGGTPQHDSDMEQQLLPPNSARILEESMQRIDECGLSVSSARNNSSPGRPSDYVRLGGSRSRQESPSVSVIPRQNGESDRYNRSPSRGSDTYNRSHLGCGEKRASGFSPFLTRGISDPSYSPQTPTKLTQLDRSVRGENPAAALVAPMVRLPQGYFESATAPQSSYRIDAADALCSLERPALLSLTGTGARHDPGHGHPSGRAGSESKKPSSRPLSPSSQSQPAPLKLRNIEYLLRHLDNASISLSPSSSQEFSGTEADRVEAGSNTESHGDPPDAGTPAMLSSRGMLANFGSHPPADGAKPTLAAMQHSYLIDCGEDSPPIPFGEEGTPKE